MESMVTVLLEYIQDNNKLSCCISFLIVGLCLTSQTWLLKKLPNERSMDTCSEEVDSNDDKSCTNLCIKRLQQELLEADKIPLQSCSVGPRGGNLLDWVATIAGPANSPYEGGTFFVELTFSPEYPFKPPKVTFQTKIYHCNINSQGMVCLDILKDQWTPAFSIEKILLSIHCLLHECNPEDPLVGSIARQFINDRRTHDKIARNWTKRYAK